MLCGLQEKRRIKSELFIPVEFIYRDKILLAILKVLYYTI